MHTYTTRSPEETIALGEHLAKLLTGGHIITLEGQLGAGKTTFMKGVATGLGIHSPITSPTFTLMNTHPLTNQSFSTLIHVDTYRLESSEDLVDIGITDYLGMPDTVCMIEWPDKVADLLAEKEVITLSFAHSREADGTRIIESSVKLD